MSRTLGNDVETICIIIIFLLIIVGYLKHLTIGLWYIIIIIVSFYVDVKNISMTDSPLEQQLLSYTYTHTHDPSYRAF